MGGGSFQAEAQEASPQQGMPLSPVRPSRMTEATIEERLQALQDRLDEEIARRSAAEAEVIRLHRSLATEMELRQALEGQLRGRPSSPSKESPPALHRRSAASRHGLSAGRGPLFGSSPERRQGENGAIASSLPAIGPQNVGLERSPEQPRGVANPGGSPSTQPEIDLPTPPQEVPARREAAGVPRSLNGAFERAGGASGVLSPGLSPGLLERLSQESDEREEALVQGSGNQPVSASHVKLEEAGGPSGAPQGSGLTRGLMTGLDGGLRADLGGGVGLETGGNLRSGLEGGLRNGLNGASGNGLDRDAFQAGLRNELVDEDSIATQVHEDEGQPEVFGGGGLAAAAAAPPPDTDQTGFGSVFPVKRQSGQQWVGGLAQSQGGVWGQVSGLGGPPTIQGGSGRGVFGGGQAGTPPATCYKCGPNRILELTAKKGANAGKRFYKCEQCGDFLHWKEPIAGPSTSPRANGHVSPRPQAGYTGAQSPAGRGQKRPWEQGGGSGACRCGGQAVEKVTRGGKNAGRKYLICGNPSCNKWLRWVD